MGKPANMPGYVYDSIQRQYKGGKNYTIEDKKNVINWYKKAKSPYSRKGPKPA